MILTLISDEGIRLVDYHEAPLVFRVPVIAPMMAACCNPDDIPTGPQFRTKDFKRVITAVDSGHKQDVVLYEQI